MENKSNSGYDKKYKVMRMMYKEYLTIHISSRWITKD